MRLEGYDGRERGRDGCRFAQHVERGQLGSGPEYTDDRVRSSTEHESAARHLRIAVESILPELMADDGHQRMVGQFVRARQGPSESNRRPQNVEQTSGRSDDDDLRRLAGAGESRRAPFDRW